MCGHSNLKQIDDLKLIKQQLEDKIKTSLDENQILLSRLDLEFSENTNIKSQFINYKKQIAEIA